MLSCLVIRIGLMQRIELMLGDHYSYLAGQIQCLLLHHRSSLTS